MPWSKMKRARPQGLGAAAKKTALDTQASSVQAKDAGKVGKLVFELPEDATAFDQVKALYETALVSLEDPEKALPIFNGVVHECLRLEKIRDTEETPSDLHPEDNDIDSFMQVKKDADRIFCAEYFFVFGDSLRTIAELSMAEMKEESFEDVKGLFLAAKEKLETSLSQQASNDSFSEALSESFSRCCLFVKIFEGETVKVDEDSIDCFSDALEFMISFVEFIRENGIDSHSVEQVKEVCAKVLQQAECTEELKISVEIKGIDQKLRFALAEEEELDSEKVSQMQARLDILVNTISDSDLKYEALMLKGSILEASGKDEEAKLVYSEAEKIDPNVQESDEDSNIDG